MNTMKGLGGKMVALQAIKKVLETLQTNFDHIVVAIEESKNLEELSLKEIQDFLESHDRG